jgi:tetratricopeptide (TPR) repeat protein
MELNPEDPVCCCNVGVVLREKGKTLEAMGYFKKALKVDPGYVNGLFNLARAEDELGYKADAVEHYRRYLDTVDRTDPWERDLVKLAVAAVDRLRSGRT